MKIFLCLIGLFAAAAALPMPNDRIVGGSNAPPEVYIWQVSMRRLVGGSHYCGGSLISMDWVMSACHCSLSGAKAAIGSTKLSEPLEIISGTFTCNPNYNSNTISNDFSVFKLDTSATAGKSIGAVNLPAAGQVFTGTAITTGWGYMYNQPDPNTIPNDLQVGEVPLVDRETCNDAWTILPNAVRVDDSMQCAGGNGITSCNGDSGGPLVQEVNGEWVLIGAVSWGSSSCSTTTPAAYARIAYARDWINQVTGL